MSLDSDLLFITSPFPVFAFLRMNFRCVFERFALVTKCSRLHMDSYLNSLFLGVFKNLTQGLWQSRRCIVLLQANRCKKPIVAWLLSPSELPTSAVCFLNVGNGISVEGALLTEQDVNHPKPAKRARTSFTADQLQVDVTMNLWFLKPLPIAPKQNFMLSKIMFMFSKRLAYTLCEKKLWWVYEIHIWP